MNRMLVALILVLTMWALLMTSGCSTLDIIEDKIVEMRMNMVAPWADDKPIVLDECPRCIHLGPLQYEEMLIALRDV
mgnify:CR=1 FL=1|tara:strand:- start:774 stop:1004 length:231 start_codon:yes stop_codon:yes gene_type:complete